MKNLVFIFVVVALLSACAKEARFHAEYRVLIREARSSPEKKQYEFEYRLLCYAERNELASHFSLADGVDEFEAWALAKAYSDENIGACSGINIPEMQDSQWVIRSWIGRGAKAGPLLYADPISGHLKCEGHASIGDPVAYLARYYAKFKST